MRKVTWYNEKGIPSMCTRKTHKVRTDPQKREREDYEPDFQRYRLDTQ